MSDRIAKEDYVDDAIAAIPPGGGAVDSVNGETGVVVLDAADVGADASGAASGAIATHAGAADPHADRSFATSAIGTHAGASDPHPAYALEAALGTLATQSGTFSGTSSGTNTGDQTLPTRASLGLATGDTPQFTGIEVGAASDTTLARSGAGDLTVEGNALYRAGGTDVPVADGGTGASTASLARTNLGLVIGTDVRAQGSGDPTLASLGLATSDSPQLAAVNVGHATDTTLARVSAGVLSVEGNTLYAAGGTDVPVADGGTGASTALAARANLGAASSAIRGLLPTGALYHSFPRQTAAANLGLLATGRLSIAMIEMDAGVTLTSITFLSGTTALSVGVNQWFALFDSSRALLRVTVDGTSGAWAANAEKPLALSSTFLTTYSGIYFVGIMVKATTVPSLICASGNANVNAVTLPITGGNSTTGLTDPASCPNPAGAIAGGVGFPYFYVS